MTTTHYYGFAVIAFALTWGLLGWKHSKNKDVYLNDKSQLREDDNNLIVHRAIIEVAKKREEE